MLLDDLLSSDAYTPVNKFLSRKLGFECAWYLWELIRQRARFWWNEFYFKQKDMEDEVWISEYAQRQYVKKLTALWLISVEKKWIPCKYYFTINDLNILKLFDEQEVNDVKNKCFKFWSTGALNFEAHNNNIIIRNDYNIIADENSSALSTADEQPTAQQSADNNEVSSSPQFDMIYNTLPACKWWDYDKTFKEYQKKIEKWCADKDIYTWALIYKLQLREWVLAQTYTKKKETRMKDFCKLWEDELSIMIYNILYANWDRRQQWVNVKTNTPAELSEYFGKDMINSIYKQVQKDFNSSQK